MINPASTAWDSGPRSRFAILLLSALLVTAAAAITPAHGAACPDADLDGYADCTVPGCDPSGLLCGDCDDARGAVYPGASEVCDQLDNDCDGFADEGFPIISTSREVRDPGASGGDSFGRAVAAIGDVDRDGVDDFVVGAPNDDPGALTDAGSVALFSGRTRALRCRATDPEGTYNDGLGWSVAGLGDVDHDGTPDFAAGAVYDDTAQGGDAGSVLVFSGANCARLLKLTDTGGASSDYLGYAVAGPGDVTGDGTPDVAGGVVYDDVGSATNAGSVVLFSGANGAVIRKLTDPSGASSDLLGGALAAAGDVNHDGTPDVAAGGEGYNGAGADRGEVIVFSGADGSILLRLTDPQSGNYERLGYSVAAIGDLNHDGTEDLAAGAPDNSAQATNAGRVIVFSGGDGTVLIRLTDPAGAASDRLGRSVAALGDVDGDGTVDVAAGAPLDDSAPGADVGAVLLFSGGSGAVISKQLGSGGAANDQTGASLAAAFDLTGDGEIDLVAGAPEASSPEGTGTGKVVLFARESDCDGDGFTPLTGDCRDDGGAGSANVRPGASEICNAIDDDCDGAVDEDDDADGYAACAGDCNNADPRVHPGAAERCNATDDDCDGSADEGPDADLDGVTAPCDCDDGRAAVHPGASEVCNGLDDDCDGVVDEGAAATTTAAGVVDPGAEVSDQFGHAVAVVGDVDGDGVDDFVVGAPNDDIAGYSDRGSVVLYSGRTRALRCRATDPEGTYNDTLGWSVAGVGDVDHDGTPDFAAGAYGDSTAQGSYAGSVLVFSGATCARLLKLTDPGGASSDYLGYSVAGPGDVDGDGTPDVAAGALYDDTTVGTNSGSVVLFSGGSGLVLYKTFDAGGAASDYLGISLAAVGDVDRDGITDFAAGAEYDDVLGGGDAGSVVLFSGATGAKLRKLSDPGGASYDHLGVSVAGIGDIDGDLVPDVLVGSYYDDTAQGSNTGSVLLFSGATGTLIRKLTDPAGVANDYLGRSVAGLPDVNGDGIPDVVAGAPNNDAAATDAGRVVIFSGADGTVLQRFTDPAAGGTDNLGTAVAVAELSGGGKPELLGGAEGAPLPEGQDAGKVVVFSFEADCDGDGESVLLDCNDADAAIGVGALERCNAVDDDCDGVVDEDDDADGYAACAGDCNNADPRVHPGAPERCNATDDDCDGSADEGPDADLDGVTAPCDCDDGRAAVHPGASEVCNGRDDDCDGIVDEGIPEQLAGLKLVDPAAAARDDFGHGAASIGDVDGDGIADFAVGVDQDDSASVGDRGSVALFSGATRTLRCRASDPEGTYNDYLGWSVAGVGDVDHDGTPDFAAGAVYDDTAQGGDAGSVLVFSGATCARLRKLTDTGGASSDWLGYSVAGLGDVNGDGTPDVAAGVVYDDTTVGSNSGSVVVFSGASGAVLYKAFDPGGATSDYLGISLAAVGDVDRDGITDFAAGAEYDDALAGTDAGSVVLFSGATGAKLRKLSDPGGASYDYLGVSVAGIGDVDGDLVPDVVAGAFYDDTAQGSNTGSVVLFSGATGAPIRKLTDTTAVTNDYLGRTVAVLPDVNGDGVPEIAAGAPYSDVKATDAGRVVVFSGADGSVLYRFTDSDGAANDRLGETVVVSLGDISRGGKPEILAGVPLDDGDGTDQGSVVIFSFEADCDGDGWSPAGGDCDDTDFATNPSAAELCDDRDNDCDGSVDEGLQDDPEVCNGLDDNCNGLADEGDPGSGGTCTTGLPGVCNQGVQHCDGGSLLCQQNVGPGPELCDGLDNDCDGSVDETADSDGDGDDDCHDNCVDAYNPDQANADGDQWGDLCDCTPSDNANPPPPAVGNTVTVTRLTGGSVRINWTATPEGDTYNVYRGWRITGDPFAYNHQCMENRSADTVAVDDVVPRKGVAFFYLVTAYCGSNSESNCGSDSAGITRPNADPCPAETLDDDGDGWEEAQDNCPGFRNDSQSDADSDSRGDVCDNCPSNANTDQGDLDGDHLGDVCDPDQDADGILDDGGGNGVRGDQPCTGGATAGCDDNCPRVVNPGQEDSDHDGIGNACDPA